jgi:hypothetical protein
LTERATPLGQQMRAAHVCEFSIPVSVQDRAGWIEATATALQQINGGVAARDAFLRTLAPPLQRARQRDDWCKRRDAEVVRTAKLLDSDAAEHFALRAEALLN